MPRLGLGVAIDYALMLGLDAIETCCREFGDTLREELRRLPGVWVYGLGSRPSAIVSFSIDGHEADTVKAALAEAGINVSTSTASGTLS